MLEAEPQLKAGKQMRESLSSPGLIVDRDPTVKERGRAWCGIPAAWRTVQRYWINDGPKAVIIILYLLATVGVFMERYYHYYWGSGKGAYRVMGQGVTFARGSAAAIKLNSLLILFPVCRNFVSYLRGTWLNNIIPFDKNIIAHRMLAWAIAFWTVVHVFAHGFNWYNIAKTDIIVLNQDLKTSLAATPSVWQQAFLSIPGSTGHAMLLVMVLMYTSAMVAIRRPYFEAFWYTHHLFVFYFALGIVHGQSNLLEMATFWIWVTIPCLVYLIERTLRILKAKRPAILLKAIQHPSRVIELQMRIDGFQHKPGQYLFMLMPFLSRQEWHPFTISSAPQEEYVGVHIRIVGDWTGMMYQQLNPDKKPLGVIQENVRFAANGLPILKVDGPFGAASEDVFKYKSVILVGAGIGVTPFASILKSIRYNMARAVAQGVEAPLHKVYFFWISRDKESFEWFGELLSALEKDNPNNFLEVNVYLTGYLRGDKEIRAAMFSPEDAPDVVTGLQSKTHYGRPNWDQIFDGMKEKHHGETMGVFFCGPPVLSKQLYKLSRKKSSKKETRFKYHKENF